MPVALLFNQDVSAVFILIFLYSEPTFPPATFPRSALGDGLVKGAHEPVLLFSFTKPELPFTSPEEVIEFGLVCPFEPPTQEIVQKLYPITIALNVECMQRAGLRVHFIIQRYCPCQRALNLQFALKPA